MRPYVAELARVADCAVSCYPNAGLPNAFGEYDERPADTGGYLEEFARSGFLNIVGGCCGTTPDHIAAIARAVRDVPPRGQTRPAPAAGGNRPAVAHELDGGIRLGHSAAISCSGLDPGPSSNRDLYV